MSTELARHRIHDHRVRLGLSPEQYGVHIGVSGMTVRRVERGYLPTLVTRAKFGNALGINHVDLFGMAGIGCPDMPTMVRARKAVAA